MEQDEIRRLFCTKLALELKRFKIRIKKQGAEIVFEKAYLIDTVVNLYELMLEECQNTDVQSLKELLAYPCLLSAMYHGWLKRKDSHMEELQSFVRDSMEGVETLHKDMAKTQAEKEAA